MGGVARVSVEIFMAYGEGSSAISIEDLPNHCIPFVFFDMIRCVPRPWGWSSGLASDFPPSLVNVFGCRKI